MNGTPAHNKYYDSECVGWTKVENLASSTTPYIVLRVALYCIFSFQFPFTISMILLKIIWTRGKITPYRLYSWSSGKDGIHDPQPPINPNAVWHSYYLPQTYMRRPFCLKNINSKEINALPHTEVGVFPRQPWLPSYLAYLSDPNFDYQHT